MSFVLIAVALITVITTYEIWSRSRSPFGLPKASFSWPKPIQYLIHYFTSNNGKTISSIVSGYRAKYGDIFVMPIMGKDYVVLTGEEGVNWAAKQERDDNFARVFANNAKVLLTSNPDSASKKDVWKSFRSTVSPALMQSSVINNFCPTMVQVIDKHLSQTNVLDADVLSAITFEVGWLFIVGKRGFESRQRVHQYYKDVRMAINSLPFNLPGSQLRKGLEARAKIVATGNKIVADDPTAKDDPDCCLPSILETNGDQLSAARILGFLFAATDTTSMTLSGLLWNLIENPAITKELQKEIRANPDPQSLGDFQKFPYLNKVVHETLRLYGVDVVFRSAKTVLQHNNIQFPAETLFAITTGYDHSSVKNPQQFDPEREEKYKLEPFGTPSRNCLGKVFAQFQMKMILQRLLKNYNVVGEKDEGASVRQGFVVKLKNARLKLARPV